MKKHNYTIIDVEILHFAKRLCKTISKKFGVKYNNITIMSCHDDFYNSCWGYCCGKDIVLKFKNGQKYMPIDELVDTVAHEMAHIEDEKEDGLHHKDWEQRYKKYKKWLYKKSYKESELCLKEMIQ